jgi:hypothetical protein
MHVQACTPWVENLHLVSPCDVLLIEHVLVLRNAPTWVWMNKDSLLRAACDKILLTSATMGGSCAYPDQSRGLARVHNLRAISVLAHPTPFYPFSSGVV